MTMTASDDLDVLIRERGRMTMAFPLWVGRWYTEDGTLRADLYKGWRCWSLPGGTDLDGLEPDRQVGVTGAKILTAIDLATYIDLATGCPWPDVLRGMGTDVTEPAAFQAAVDWATLSLGREDAGEAGHGCCDGFGHGHGHAVDGGSRVTMTEMYELPIPPGMR